MAEITRRRFIRDASIGVAAAGAAAAVAPGLGGTASAWTFAPTAPAAGPSGGRRTSGPIVAHVVDARTGDIAVYFGDQVVHISDRAIAQQLAAATR